LRAPLPAGGAPALPASVAGEVPLKILLTTTGSLGDLHPFMAIGIALLARGHTVTIATSKTYQQKIEGTGLQFAPMGPHLSLGDTDVIRRVMDQRRGPEYLIRKIMLPSVPAVYEEAMAAARQADLIVTHPITFAAQIVAEVTGLPWISTVTAPFIFFSRFDPPVLAPAPFLAKLRGLGAAINGLVLGAGRVLTRRWTAPLARFRRSLGLPAGRNPLFEGQHSPQRVLALFSRVMAEAQADWPPQTRTTGFPFYHEAEHEQELDPALERFLDAGPAPVVFTLGSSAVHRAGAFYEESLGAIRQLGCRAVLLVGNNRIAGPLPPATAIFPYAPFARIFPRASAIVHQGGIGTCAQAVVAGRPMLVVPYGFDQPDNAARLERLGVARVMARSKYSGRRASAELRRLLADPAYSSRAAEIARRVSAEDGVQTACEVIEAHPQPPSPETSHQKRDQPASERGSQVST
jgi:rhamnosyltransferase subunit B